MGGRRENSGGNRASTSGRSGTARLGRSNDAESSRSENTDGLEQYEGSNLSTGSQTPEGVTSPMGGDTGSSEIGMAEGNERGDMGMERGAAAGDDDTPSNG
jgi:hypothetical protein